MATDYYIHEPSGEREAVERWENEGGRLQQHHRYSYDSIGTDYLAQLKQSFVIGGLYQQNDIARAISSLLSKRSMITGQIQTLNGEHALPEFVSA